MMPGRILLIVALIGSVFSFSENSMKAANSLDGGSVEINEFNNLDCNGFETASTSTALTAYFPSHPGDFDDGNTLWDIRGQRLHTLQDFLANRSHFVTVSMDASLRLPYATRICIAELNHHFGRHIPFEVRDSNDDLAGANFDQIEICVESEANSYESIVNLPDVTVHIQQPHFKYL